MNIRKIMNVLVVLVSIYFLKRHGFEGIPIVIGIIVLRNIKQIISALIYFTENLWRTIKRNKWAVINFLVVVGFIVILCILKTKGIPVILTIVALGTRKKEVIIFTIFMWVVIGVIYLLAKLLNGFVFPLPLAAALLIGVPLFLDFIITKVKKFIRWINHLRSL